MKCKKNFHSIRSVKNTVSEQINCVSFNLLESGRERWDFKRSKILLIFKTKNFLAKFTLIQKKLQQICSTTVVLLSHGVLLNDLVQHYFFLLEIKISFINKKFFKCLNIVFLTFTLTIFMHSNIFFASRWDLKERKNFC